MSDPAAVSRADRGRQARPLLRTMLGDVLRRTRLRQRRTLADVARSARVSLPYLSEIERGRKEASSEVLAAICDALGIDLADLLTAAGHRLDQARRPAVVRLAAVSDRRSGFGFGPGVGPADAMPGSAAPAAQPADDLAITEPATPAEAVVLDPAVLDRAVLPEPVMLPEAVSPEAQLGAPAQPARLPADAAGRAADAVCLLAA